MEWINGSELEKIHEVLVEILAYLKSTEVTEKAILATEQSILASEQATLAVEQSILATNQSILAIGQSILASLVSPPATQIGVLFGKETPKP
jgi:hypothetical protein